MPRLREEQRWGPDHHHIFKKSHMHPPRNPDLYMLSSFIFYTIWLEYVEMWLYFTVFFTRSPMMRCSLRCPRTSRSHLHCLCSPRVLTWHSYLQKKNRMTFICTELIFMVCSQPLCLPRLLPCDKTFCPYPELSFCLVISFFLVFLKLSYFQAMYWLFLQMCLHAKTMNTYTSTFESVHFINSDPCQTANGSSLHKILSNATWLGIVCRQVVVGTQGVLDGVAVGEPWIWSNGIEILVLD
jgi:hypothetical protein